MTNGPIPGTFACRDPPYRTGRMNLHQTASAVLRSILRALRTVLPTLPCIALTCLMTPAQSHVVPTGFGDALVMGGWSGPVGCTWDVNGRMYVWEKRGRVWIVENGVRLTTALVNIDQEVGNWGDHGLLGFTLDPDFLNNGHIYLMYAVDRHHLMHFGTPAYDPFATEANAASILRITRYTAVGPQFNTVDPASRLVLLGETKQTGVPITFNTHGAGSLLFGNDGTLLASVGDGASAVGIDVGNATDSYYLQAMGDSIIRNEENVGAWRAQMVNSLNGKVLRLDPATGNGVSSNPWFDAGAPRSPRSRVWALGLRNPYRMTIAPNSGSTDPSQGRPGVLYISDVGWSSWEEVSICNAAGMNFGWPQYEGMEASPYAPLLVENRDVPNPGYDGINCTIPFLRFQDLLLQATPSHAHGHPSPCDPAQQLPNNLPKFFHARPAVDWKHGNQSRCAGFDGNTAVAIDLDAPNAPVPGPRFGGYAAMAGPTSSQLVLPLEYWNSMFFGDYVNGFIKRMELHHGEDPVAVHDFADGLGAINFLGADPDGCIVYIKYNSTEIRRICYTEAVDLPPVAVATQSVQYGTTPLTVSFTGSGSSDPENGPLTYHWDFGDGSPHAHDADPVHVFEAPPGVPTRFDVVFEVTDENGHTATRHLIVSLNNTPPEVAITSFANGAFYPVGVDTTFQLVAEVTDLEHGPSELGYAWVTTLHHNTHVHPGPPVQTPTGNTVVNGEGCLEDTYAYDVTLTVTDAAGLSTSVTHFVYPRCHAIAPTAIIQSNISAGAGPLSVQFTGSQSYDPGTIVSYLWDFSDGTTSTAADPFKVFTEPGDHVVTLTVTDNDGLTGTASRVISVITFEAPACAGPAGQLLREFYLGVGGATILDLLNHPTYPNTPTGSTLLTSFRGPRNAFGGSFGTRVRGYIVPPESGKYVFTVTSDDASVVYLGLNADPRYKRVICSVPGSTDTTQFNKYPVQVSDTIVLQAGVHYFVELLHKDLTGADHFTLFWQTPSEPTRTVIPGSALVRWQNCMPSVRARAMLQGAWTGPTTLMRDDLRAAALLPTTEPFTALGMPQAGGGGGETVAPERFLTTGKNAVVDWVRLELRSAADPTVLVATRSALLERDGDIVGTNGNARILFSVPEADYYLCVRHRNHLGAMTKQAVRLDRNETGIDLSLSGAETFGTNAQVKLLNGRQALWCGNVHVDRMLRYSGTENDRDPILHRIGGSITTASVHGYYQEDVNLDGVVRYSGMNNDRDPILRNVGGTIPTAVRTDQVP